VNILLVASVFRLRRRLGTPRLPRSRLSAGARRHVFVLALFLVAAIAYNPRDTLIGMAMTATALPVYALDPRRGTSVSGFRVRNAYGNLERVIMHRPGPELGKVTPETLREFHFTGRVDREKFVADYDACSARCGATVSRRSSCPTSSARRRRFPRLHGAAAQHDLHPRPRRRLLAAAPSSWARTSRGGRAISR
jgi:hypothetical protein